MWRCVDMQNDGLSYCKNLHDTSGITFKIAKFYHINDLNDAVNQVFVNLLKEFRPV
jgi:hypothetical protein